MRLLGALLVGVGLFAGCVQQPMGSLLCPDPPMLCGCQDNADRGGVVVRWRIADASVGQLLDRGECCCNPSSAPSDLLLQQCGNIGRQCLDTPAWLVRNVRLHIKSVSLVDQSASAVDCTIKAPCPDGELTTQYCLKEGTYDLQLSADIEIVNKSGSEFICSNTQTLSPPAVRRTVKPGQAVNLDGIVLGINAPPVNLPVDGGSTDGGSTD